MKNGGFIKGWAPEEPPDDVNLVANELFKSKLNEIWKKISEDFKKGIRRGLSVKSLNRYY